MGISAVICTKNEERNIGRCLLSLHDVVDEIIVVDSKSTDKTKSICQTFSKVKFFESDWMGFSKTKNYANSLASQDYILSLDADEELSAACQNEINRIKKNLKGVYSINRLTNYCGQWIKHSGWYPDLHIRLFPKHRAEWQGEIHETLQCDPMLSVHKIEGVVYHYTYYSIEEHWSRINIYTTLSATKYINKGKISLIFLMLFNSQFRFIRHFFLKRGFLDGFNGLVISVFSAVAVFIKYAKAYQLKKKKDSSSL